MKNKIKLPKSVLKRIKKITRRHKVMVVSMSAQHLASNKSKRRRTSAKNSQVLHGADQKRLVKYNI
ncbi:MAG TPA: hypothetical protein VJL27_02550 [Patescibacteria group bacterium]|nr:hypothetical protein [Patescibacteria group bacterium]